MEAPATVDIADFLAFQAGQGELTPELQQLCSLVTESFHQTGILILRTPKVDEAENWRFIDMMERYFLGASQHYYNGDKVAEVFPELGFQVGATPELTEKARNHCERINNYPESDKPQSLCPPQFDAKWRYFWRVGALPEQDAGMNFNNVVPEHIPEWPGVMDSWGSLMLNSVETVVTMCEIGMGLQKGRITDMMQQAPHLLAPTGSDLAKFGHGTIFAGFHYDLNFITIHGKSRYPGLFAWLRNGKKIPVRVPDGCLLLQAGKEFEYLTGGFVLAGFHEVVYTDSTEEAVQRARAESRPLWRVSSTLFSHLRTDLTLAPLPELSEKYSQSPAETEAKYPALNTAAYIRAELIAIGLLKAEDPVSEH